MSKPNRIDLMARLEHRSQPLLPFRSFLGRMGRAFLYGGSIVLICLVIGVIGYHELARLRWLDSLVNASMILGGMGPVDPVTTTSGKWFEALYALFSGVMFLTSVGVFLAPALHRMLHKLHLESGRGD